MGYNNEIQPSRPNVTEIITKLRHGEYYVDRSFQRRLIWTDRQKVRLIETVLMDFPMPEIYLWEQPPNPETGQQSFSIVDGQQRLSSLKEFTSNEWSLKKAFLDEGHRGEEYVDCFWKDLTPELRAKIYQYNINARRIPSVVPESEIRQMFARLNETDRSLNPQEMRHATLNGEFLTASLALADSEEMQLIGIFNKDNIRRMGDVEFASQLLGYERKGIVNDTPKSMNELYDDFSNEYADAARDLKRVKGSLKLIGDIFKEPSLREFFGTQNYIYTLHTFFDTMPKKSAANWIPALKAFSQAYALLPDGKVEQDQADPDLLEFKKGASSRTRSKASRTDRLFGLKKWIVKNYPDLA